MLDRNGRGGGILVYVQKVKSSKKISIHFLNKEGFFLEINLRKEKWVTCCSYNPRYMILRYNMESVGNALNFLFRNH